MTEAIGVKRGIEYVRSSSSLDLSGSEKKRKAEVTLVNDDPYQMLESAAECAAYSKKKLYEMEKQLFLRSINKEDSHEMTDDERRKFETKGWCLNSDLVIVMSSDDWYVYLCIDSVKYGDIVYVKNTYEGDLKYDEFYKALWEVIQKGMSFEQILETATLLRGAQFPMVMNLALHSACLDAFQTFEREKRMEERIRLLSKLWTEIVYKKRDFKEVMEEIYADICSYGEVNMRIITQFLYKEPLRCRIFFWLKNFCDYVGTHNANQTCEDIEKTAKAFCWDRENNESIFDFDDPEPITYAMYVKEKLRLASSLGRNTLNY